MNIHIAQLSGDTLDLAVARCMGFEIAYDPMGFKTGSESGYWIWKNGIKGQGNDYRKIGLQYSPSSNWSQGGPIIEQEKIVLINPTFDNYFMTEYPWLAWKNDIYGAGNTPLEAAMRCYVASINPEIISQLDQKPLVCHATEQGGISSKSVLGGWQTVINETNELFGPVFNSSTDLWQWQRKTLYSHLKS